MRYTSILQVCRPIFEEVFLTRKIAVQVQGKYIELFLEGVFWKKVSKSLFFKHLRDKPLVEEEFYAIEKKVAEEVAIALLARYSYFSSGLRRKLQSKGFSEEAVCRALEHCQKKGYLDDLARTLQWVESEERRGKGAKAIAFALQKRGIVLSPDMILKIRKREPLTLKEWCQKFRRKMDSLTLEQRIACLLRRGFSMETIRSHYAETF